MDPAGAFCSPGGPSHGRADSERDTDDDEICIETKSEFRTRFASVKKCASAMEFVAVRFMIAASPGGAALVPSPRSAGRLSWRR